MVEKLVVAAELLLVSEEVFFSEQRLARGLSLPDVLGNAVKV